MDDGGGEGVGMRDGKWRGGGAVFFFFFCWLLYSEPSPLFMSVRWKSLLNPPIKPAEVSVYVKREA